VVVGRLPDAEETVAAAPPSSTSQPDEIERLGLTVIDIDDNVRKQLGIEEAGGALVSSVTEGAARAAGIQRGDIVQMFDGTDVKSARHLRELIDEADGKRSVAVLVRRGEDPLFTALRLGE
jgi:serine protease Do